MFMDTAFWEGSEDAAASIDTCMQLFPEDLAIHWSTPIVRVSIPGQHIELFAKVQGKNEDRKVSY
jgi:hypothetical protein